MMATSGDHEIGYEDSRFETVISQRFHCSICFLVLKDPVMCKNQHCYCSSCIKKYLENSASCPTCREHLSVDTLSNAPRILTDYLSELEIHCDFCKRGCPEMVQVGNLKRHVDSCGFAPVPCLNDSCNVLVNRSDKFRHETDECDFRRLKGMDCGEVMKEVRNTKDEMLARQNLMKEEIKAELKNEMKEMKKKLRDEIKGEMKGMKEEIQGEIREVVREMNEMRCEMKLVMTEVKVEVKGKKEEVKDEVKEVIKEMKNEIKDETKNEMKQDMNKIKVEEKNKIREIVVSAMQDMMMEMKDFKIKNEEMNAGRKEEKSSPQMPCFVNSRAKIIIAGGKVDGEEALSSSVEMFDWPTQSWKKLNPMSECRSIASSFVYKGHMTVAGGQTNDGRTSSIISLNLADPAATWKDSAAKLPVKYAGKIVVNHNDQLIMSGGWGQNKRSDAVHEVQLVPPYRSKMLTRLPEPRTFHGMELFDMKLFILGGYVNGNITNSVVQYDIQTNECKEVPPLPYAVGEMATVLWQNNVLLLGGQGKGTILSTVVMYDVITGRSQMLPRMKHKQRGCTAVITGNKVVVMGGENDDCEFLKSVECFDLERQVWQDLPDMLEARGYATAVIIETT